MEQSAATEARTVLLCHSRALLAISSLVHYCGHATLMEHGVEVNLSVTVRENYIIA